MFVNLFQTKRRALRITALHAALQIGNSLDAEELVGAASILEDYIRTGKVPEFGTEVYDDHIAPPEPTKFIELPSAPFPKPH